MKKKIFILLIVVSILIVFTLTSFAVEETKYTSIQIVKEIAKCAVIKGDLERLEAYDKLAQLLGVASPKITYLEEKETGKWNVSKKINPIDDTITITFVLRSDSGKSTYGKPISMILRYRSGETEAYISWDSCVGNMLTDEVEVLTRIGDEKAITLDWGSSTDYKATFYPGNDIEFIKKLMDADKLVTQVTPYFESPITAVFDVRGLKNAVEEFNDILGWIKV